MKLDVEGTFYNIVIEKKPGNRNTYIRVKKDLTVQVTTNKFTSDRTILKLIEDNYEKIVLTMDRLYSNTTEDGIKIKYLIDFLLEE